MNATVTSNPFIDRYFSIYPKEFVSTVEKLASDEIADFLQRQTVEHAAEILEYFVPDRAAEVLPHCADEFANQLIKSMDPARAALVLGLADEDVRDRILTSLESRTAAELTELMTYPTGTAGRLMSTRIITFHPDTTVQKALAKYRRLGARIRNLIVADEDRSLVGLIPLPEVVLAKPGTRLKELVQGSPPYVMAVSPRDQAVEILNTHDVTTLPVVDGSLRVIGILSHDALIQSLQEKVTAGLQTMVGAGKEEQALSSPWLAVRKRLPWLNINLLTAFVAAAVVGLFENTIAQFTALAILLPVVAGQSGNTGAQALAVVMRGLALREIRPHHTLRVLFKEGIAGALNGVAIALVTSIGVWFWSGSAGLSMVIAIAMVASMILAGLAGATIPLVLTAIRQDPAQSGSIILTTVTDVVGFLSFLGLATIFASLI